MVIKLEAFREIYINNLANQCVIDCFADLCSGWTQETFRQVVMTLTRKGAAPIKLWFDSPEEMTVLSNKRPALQELFRIMDHNNVGRIDTLEIFAVILISIQGKFEIILQNMMTIFGFNNENEFSRDEFHFFLDCMFRGLLKLAIPKGSKKPIHPGKKMTQSDIETLVSQIFPNNIDLIERSDFIERMTPSKDITQMIQYFHTTCLQSVVDYRQRILDRIQITHFVRKLLLDVTRSVYAKIKEIEDLKAIKAKEEEIKQKELQDQYQQQNLDSSISNNLEVSMDQREALQSKGVYIDPSNPRKIFHKDSQRRMWKQQ
ncbi:UNKNOWN [Stylonychia lemnae]|uniref:EF-hand domain-containing protein n=1 Tax=Stylonychia lemnae TaxID=5949 RepID=A0A078AMP9_STYLE|nr:UNKNOWN [Stylonychia lemnae]|eukprot:CDW83191.1 UNKNOWN [Stylonychia lemnae]